MIQGDREGRKIKTETLRALEKLSGPVSTAIVPKEKC